MSDTYQGECRICGEDTDLIVGICQECTIAYDKFEDWCKECAFDFKPCRTR